MVNKVTVTGADDSVSITELHAIAESYPFVEFGILLSVSSTGLSRFPSDQWLERLLFFADHDARLSGHICGSMVNQIYLGDWPERLLRFDQIFNRWQLNTHGIETPYDTLKLGAVIRERNEREQTVIFQYDNVNHRPLMAAAAAGLEVSALFDLSHGAGVLPEEWPKPLDNIFCGYAGGLSAANVAEQLTKLEEVVGDREIWIDAETRLRSDNDAKFDLDKVVAFLEASKPWINDVPETR